MERQRLDKWLWHARIVKARASAAALVEGGRVRVEEQRIRVVVAREVGVERLPGPHPRVQRGADPLRGERVERHRRVPGRQPAGAGEAIQAGAPRVRPARPVVERVPERFQDRADVLRLLQAPRETLPG